MRKLAAVVSLVASCYRTAEWGATGEYRGHATHASEQEVDSKQTAVFDDKDGGLRATVLTQPQCRPLLLGDNLEERQESTRQLRGPTWMVVGSLLVAAAGGFGILFATADLNNQDAYGNPLPSRLSSSAHTELIVGGSIGVLIGIAGITSVILLPSQKRQSRWVPIEGNPHQVFTSDEPQPCQNASKAPVAGVQVHVEVRYDRGTLEWDLQTDASGVAVVDLSSARATAAYCGDGAITATVLDQTWTGKAEGARAPIAQITDDKARELAVACGGS
jgi:hypothetical protein